MYAKDKKPVMLDELDWNQFIGLQKEYAVESLSSGYKKMEQEGFQYAKSFQEFQCLPK